MVSQEIWEIYRRWLEGIATADDENRLVSALKGFSNEELLELVDRDFNEFDPGRQIFSSAESAVLLQKINASAKVVRMRPWWRTAVSAAVLILLLAAGGYLIYRQTEKLPVANVQPEKPSHDALPGGNRAMLTLSNGSTIILDSARLGRIAAQANVNIIKSDSGKLVYNILKEKPTALLYNTLTTPRGGQYQLALPDGTKVWLNAASSIKYPVAFIGKERMVEITGEAYFEVKHNAAMPFRVKAGAQMIEDIGTAFNVNAYTDEKSIKTTLLEGAVKVSMVNGQWSMLKPGEQAIINISPAFNIQHSTFNIDRSPDLELVMAWKNGLFAFRSADLQTILRQLSRWYDVEVVYEDQIPKRHITGKIGKTLTLDQVLRSLTQLGVNYTIEGKKLTIRPK